MRAYYLRVVLILLAAPFVLFGLSLLLRQFLARDTAGVIVGIAAFVGVFGGSFLVHWLQIRCPKCERWVLPVGVNGVSPSACRHCRTPLR